MPDGFPLIVGSQNHAASLETLLVRGGGFLLSVFGVENDSGGAVLGRGQGSVSPTRSAPSALPFGV